MTQLPRKGRQQNFLTASIDTYGVFMKQYKLYLNAIIAAICLTMTISAAEETVEREFSHEIDLEERDFKALHDWILTKIDTSIKDKIQHLKVTGDIHFEWQHENEKVDGIRVRGAGMKKFHDEDLDDHDHNRYVPRVPDRRCLPISRDTFDVEANLYFAYFTRKDPAWAFIHLQFDNSAGIGDHECNCRSQRCLPCQNNVGINGSLCKHGRLHGSGIADALNLKRAYMGYNVYKSEDARFDVEIGRFKMYDIFESEIEFLSRFDGIVFKYEASEDWVDDWYTYLGAFVIDERMNQFGYVGEIGFLGIAGTGFDLQYSLIDWKTVPGRGPDRCGIKPAREFNYLISQIAPAYRIDKKYTCGIPMEVYSAFLINHLGKYARSAPCLDDDGGVCGCDFKSSRHKGSENLGWYIGLTVNEVKKAGDWAIDIQYQWVQRNAIPYDDQSGIGIGNALDGNCCYIPTVGYKGFIIETLYGLTDNLTIDTSFEASTANEPGVHHTYSKFELETVFAF